MAATSRCVTTKARADAEMPVTEFTEAVNSQPGVELCVARNTAGDNTAEVVTVKWWGE